MALTSERIYFNLGLDVQFLVDFPTTLSFSCSLETRVWKGSFLVSSPAAVCNAYSFAANEGLKSVSGCATINWSSDTVPKFACFTKYSSVHFWLCLFHSYNLSLLRYLSSDTLLEYHLLNQPWCFPRESCIFWLHTHQYSIKGLGMKLSKPRYLFSLSIYTSRVRMLRPIFPTLFLTDILDTVQPQVLINR